MKTIILLLILVPYFAVSQCNPSGNGLLSADVSDDLLILRNDTVTRNCAAFYSMGISKLSSDTLIWMQTDIGDVAYCHCNFDLSVTVDSLSPGDYVVKAYYTRASDDDTCYIGSVPFSIAQPENYPAPKVIHQWQSACFTVGLEETQNSSAGQPDIYPNPAGDKIFVQTGSDIDGTIRIFNLNGQVIYESLFENSFAEISTEHLKPGVYLIKVIGSKRVAVKKFVKQ